VFWCGLVRWLLCTSKKTTTTLQYIGLFIPFKSTINRRIFYSAGIQKACSFLFSCRKKKIWQVSDSCGISGKLREFKTCRFFHKKPCSFLEFKITRGFLQENKSLQDFTFTYFPSHNDRTGSDYWKAIIGASTSTHINTIGEVHVLTPEGQINTIGEVHVLPRDSAVGKKLIIILIASSRQSTLKGQ